MERKFKAKAQTGLYLLVAAIVLVLVNLMVRGSNKRLDMTETQRYTLSRGSERLVTTGLKQDLTIDVYATKGLAKNDTFIQDLTDLLKEYEGATYNDPADKKDYTSHVKFSIIDPKTDEQKEEAKKAGLEEKVFGEGSETGKDQATFAKGYMGMVFKYGSEQDNIPYWPPEETQGLEFFVTNKIREIRDRAEKSELKIGFVTGKDELKITDNVVAPGSQNYNLRGIFEKYLPFYKFEDVDLQNGDAEINQELKGLVITQPQKDYTEKELRRIDQFLMLGNKSLVVLAGAVNLKPADPTMRATLSTHGLEKLMEGYGITMNKDVVLDWSGSFALPGQTETGSQVWIRTPWALQLSPDDRFEGDKQLLDKAFAPFFRLDQVAMPFSSSLTVHAEKQATAKLKVVARSTDKATVLTGDNLDMKSFVGAKSKGETSQRIVAVAIESACCDGTLTCAETDACKKGVIKSAFAGGDNMGVETSPESKGPSRILLVSSSQFLANPFARAGNPPPMPPQMQMMGAMGGDRELQMIARFYYEGSFPWMVMAFKNTLDWMGGDSDLVATSAKLLGQPNLKYADVEKPDVAEDATPEETQKKMSEYQDQRAKLQSKVQWTLTILPAVLFALFGLIRWRLRESSRDSISLN